MLDDTSKQLCITTDIIAHQTRMGYCPFPWFDILSAFLKALEVSTPTESLKLVFFFY